MIYLNLEIKMKAIKFFLLLFIFSLTRFYAQDDVKKYPGYVDLGSFEGLYDPEEYTEVNIEAPLLNLVAKASKNKDEELYNLLSGLKLIKVYTFQVAEDKETGVEQKMKSLTNKLNSENWERIVRVKDRGEAVNVYLKNVNDNIVGVTVLTLEKNGEAAFINIVGNIDLEAISRLSEKFNIPELDTIKKDKNKSKQ
jgi:hypothetical protein